uniref:Transmembrane protein n=1 Tax=Brassica campestris TaxID=3711 RepID=M4EE45_BRACM
MRSKSSDLPVTVLSDRTSDSGVAPIFGGRSAFASGVLTFHSGDGRPPFDSASHFSGSSPRSRHQSSRSASCGLGLRRGVGFSAWWAFLGVLVSLCFQSRCHDCSGVSFFSEARYTLWLLVRTRASLVGVWRFDGLFSGLVVYGHVVTVPEISLSSAVSLFGVRLQSAFEATGKLLWRLLPDVFSWVVSWSSMRQCDSVKLAAFRFSETASNEAVVQLGWSPAHVSSSMALLVEISISQCWWWFIISNVWFLLAFFRSLGVIWSRRSYLL